MAVVSGERQRVEESSILAPVGTISAIKLKRTDTTLDLSLMAKEAGEKEKRKCWERVEYL
jgi:hypothetical protein